MKSRWREVRIGDVCSIRPPKQEVRKDFPDDTEVSFLPMSNLGIRQHSVEPEQVRPLSEVYKSYTYFRNDDVLLAKITPCFQNGKLGIARNLNNGVGFGSTEFFVLRCNETLHPKYLFHFLTRELFIVEGVARMGGAVGQQRVPPEFVADYRIPLAPLAEQKRIVVTLDEASEAIAAATARAEKNLTNAGKLFGASMSQRLMNVAQRPPTQTLRCITDLIVDCEHKTAPYQDTGIPSIRTPNIGNGHLILEGVKRVSEKTYRAWTRRAEPTPGDLILAREAPAGNVGVIPEGTQVCLGQRTVLLRPKPDVVHPQFLAFLLLHPIMQKRLLSQSTGATVEHVNMRDIRALAISDMPSLDVQGVLLEDLLALQNFANELTALYKRKLTLLADLRQSILQKAFTGELTPAAVDAELVGAGFGE